MVKLDANVLRYMTKDEFRVLTAIEMGQKNHEIVPTTLISRIAGLKKGGATKAIALLHKNKLIYHTNKQYDGYKLTYLGYDYLALKTLAQRGQISGIGRRIGVGKESDVYEVVIEKEDKKAAEVLVLKVHRLGRTSFRAIKKNRDYLLHRKSASWLYMSRLAALREFAYLKALHAHGFPVPTPIDQNRHCVLMSLVDAVPLYCLLLCEVHGHVNCSGQIRELRHPGRLYSNLMNLIVQLAEHGLIHCDFNEFNILLGADERATLIDFPQMVSTSHKNAKMYFDRDVQCIRTFFSRKFKFDSEEFPQFFTDTVKQIDLDVQLCASGAGFTEREQAEFERFVLEKGPESEPADVDEKIQSEGETESDGEGDGQGEGEGEGEAPTDERKGLDSDATPHAAPMAPQQEPVAADPASPREISKEAKDAPVGDAEQLETIRLRVKRRLKKKHSAANGRSRNLHKSREKRSLAHQVKSDA